MSAVKLVKVQTNHRGDEYVLIYAKGKRGMVEQKEKALAKEMGAIQKRYYNATQAPDGRWTLGERVMNDPGW